MKLIDFFKLPIHFVQLFSKIKSFNKNLLIGNKFLNSKGLHILRVSLSQKMAKIRRRSLEDLVTAEQKNSYSKNGFVKVNDFLDAKTFQTVLDEINNTNFERVDMTQGSATTRRSMIDEADLKLCPALNKAKNDRRMLNLVRYVSSHYGQPLITLQTILVNPKESHNRGNDPQTRVHSDTFHPTAKAWLFLTDVEEEDGPFSYVAGSHKPTEERYIWEKNISIDWDKPENKYSSGGSMRINVEELEKLGYPKPTPMIVKANTLIVADTYGFHARCPSEKATVRIEIYSSLRRNPFLPFVASWFGGFHFLSIPFVRRRLNKFITEGLQTLQIFKKLGVRENPWKKVAYGKADELPENDKVSI